MSPSSHPPLPEDENGTRSSASSSTVIAPMTQIQANLQQTLQDLTIRTQVQECLQSMLLDVETVYYLQQELEIQANRQSLISLQKQHRATILEADAERNARDVDRAELADHLIRELMILSQEMEGLLQWKKDHIEKVEGYDELLAKLTQTEEELLAAQQIQFSGEPKARVPEQPPTPTTTSKSTVTTTTTTSTPTKDAGGEPPSSPSSSPLGAVRDISAAIEESVNEQEEAKEISSLLGGDSKPSAQPTAASDFDQQETAPTVATLPDLLGETTEQQQQQQQQLATGETPVDSGPLVVPAAATAASVAVVSLDEEEPKEESPSLMTLDMEILMAIFGFVDAIDILNLAQINLEMYSKIDNIFGITEDGQSPPQSTPAPVPAPAPVPPPQQATAPTPAPATSSKPAPTTTTTTQHSTSSTDGTSTTTATPAAAASGPIANRLFSMLQPARAPLGGTPSKKPTQSLSPSVAQSMASKLTDSEIAAILSMTDKLSKLDKEVNLLRNEKETLVAKLDGTEAVKQFLINKVRDVEIKLTQSRDNEIKVANQIASDQEVIAFLDSRVQILERQTETLTKEKSQSQSELESTKVQTSKKIAMLSDMLKYEREKLKEESGEWKATKKVLVKEVKSCRAQILALQAERDGFKEQNELLKRAMLSTGKSPSSTTASQPKTSLK